MFFVTGRMGLTLEEGGDSVVKETQNVLEMDLGRKSIKCWSQVLPTKQNPRLDLRV